jgi:hypothetical protein
VNGTEEVQEERGQRIVFARVLDRILVEWTPEWKVLALTKYHVPIASAVRRWIEIQDGRARIRARQNGMPPPDPDYGRQRFYANEERNTNAARKRYVLDYLWKGRHPSKSGKKYPKYESRVIDGVTEWRLAPSTTAPPAVSADTTGPSPVPPPALSDGATSGASPRDPPEVPSGGLGEAQLRNQSWLLLTSPATGIPASQSLPAPSDVGRLFGPESIILIARPSRASELQALLQLQAGHVAEAPAAVLVPDKRPCRRSTNSGGEPRR